MSCSCLSHTSQSPLQRLVHFAQGALHSHPAQTTAERPSRQLNISTRAGRGSAEAPEKQQRTLIRNGFLYSGRTDSQFIDDAWVLVEGKHIAQIGQAGVDEPEYDQLLDARGKMILPGFINPHWHESFVAPNFERADDSHLTPTPYSGGGDIEALGSMFGFISGVGKRLTHNEALAIARWSLWSQLRSGTTALGDLGSANTADAMAEAAIELGMRIRVSRWGADIMIPNGASAYTQIADTQEQTDDWLALMERWHDHSSGLVGGMPTVMGAFGSSDQQLQALADISSRYQCPYGTHLAPLRNERQAVKNVFGLAPIERFDHFGLLTNRLVAVHTAYASEEEYQRLMATGVNICHAPAHYGMLGEQTISETRQITRFIRDGAPVSCSTDGDVTYIGGMPEAMRAAHLGHNEAANDNTACPPTKALRSASYFGAAALGWGDRIGSIEVGKEADIVLVNIDDWRYRIGNHPLRTFIVSGGSKDVDTVMVAGQVVVRGGSSTRFDEQTLLDDYLSAAHSARSRIRP